jgi:choice-of-anchor B domain-containing protein
MNDELDELTGLAERTRTLVWDVAELEDPILVAEHFGTTGATDHNLYIKGDRMYQANYQAGLRILDISDPENPEEIGFFDTTPYDGNPPTMGGAWTAYPFFESGTLIVSSTQEGLFLLRSAQIPVL